MGSKSWDLVHWHPNYPNFLKFFRILGGYQAKCSKFRQCQLLAFWHTLAIFLWNQKMFLVKSCLLGGARFAIFSLVGVENGIFKNFLVLKCTFKNLVSNPKILKNAIFSPKYWKKLANSPRLMCNFWRMRFFYFTRKSLGCVKIRETTTLQLFCIFSLMRR